MPHDSYPLNYTLKYSILETPKANAMSEHQVHPVSAEEVHPHRRKILHSLSNWYQKIRNWPPVCDTRRIFVWCLLWEHRKERSSRIPGRCPRSPEMIMVKVIVLPNNHIVWLPFDWRAYGKCYFLLFVSWNYIEYLARYFKGFCESKSWG
jgi:hypothetical protein